MKRVKNIVLLVSTIWLSALVGGCNVYDHYSVADDPEDQDLVTLVLNIGLVAPTRAADNEAERERMHDLRIVLLDMNEDKGTVEYNNYIDFGAAGKDTYNEEGYEFIRTKPGKKKIFLIANEKSVGAFHYSENGSIVDSPSLTTVLNAWPAGSDKGGFETMVKSIYFNSDYSGNIPLTSSYAFDIYDTDLGKRVNKEFCLVHAATKFEFEFENRRTGDIQIDALSLLNLSQGMYLMANFGTKPAEEKEVTWEEGGSTQTAYWIDWLKAVSKETTERYPTDPDNEYSNKKFGWIKDYEVPTGIGGHVKRTLIEDGQYKLPSLNSYTPATIAPGEKQTLPVVYFPESRNLVAGNAVEQDYRFSITLKDPAFPDNKKSFEVKLTHIGDEDTYSDNQDNLVTLFRNTHVKIKCTVTTKGIDVNLHLHVIPWYPEDPEIWEFTDHVTVDRPMTWIEDSYEKIEGSREGGNEGDAESGEVVTLKLDGGWLEGKFRIDTPVNGKWYAELIPIGDARPNAMTFVDAEGNPAEPNSGDPAVCTKLSGVITTESDKNEVTIRIKPTVLENDQESRFYLKVTVENLGVWIEAPVFGTKNYCTIVRPGNKMN